MNGVLILDVIVVAMGSGKWIVERRGVVVEPINTSRFSMVEVEKEVREFFPTIWAPRPAWM